MSWASEHQVQSPTMLQGKYIGVEEWISHSATVQKQQNVEASSLLQVQRFQYEFMLDCPKRFMPQKETKIYLCKLAIIHAS
jgi:hypothetical protein